MNLGTPRHLLGALALCAIASGCAQAGSAMPASEAAEVSGGATTTEASITDDALDASIAAADADFAVGLDSGMSCDMIVPLRDRICMLADRICALSSASPDDLAMRAQCEDGAERCLGATEAVRRRCGP